MANMELSERIFVRLFADYLSYLFNTLVNAALLRYTVCPTS
jgi:hypothetical protein